MPESAPYAPSVALPPPAPRFRAVLTPHRSLSPAGFVILMGLLSGIGFAAGIVFWLLGAWPVFGFIGLDIAAIYIAFRLNYRHGRLVEVVELSGDALTVTRLHPSGRRQSFSFNAYWARVALREGSDGRTALRLTSHGRGLVFASFLSDDERRSLGRAIEAALHGARTATAAAPALEGPRP